MFDADSSLKSMGYRSAAVRLLHDMVLSLMFAVGRD